jgi:cell pole-organizing protein PopZ
MHAIKQSLTYLSAMAYHCVDSVWKYRQSPGGAHMSAQNAQETTMEDILASIRKIISEDETEEPADQSEMGSQLPDSNTRHAGLDPALPPPSPAPQQPVSPTNTHAETGLKTDSAEPSVLIERREYFGQDIGPNSDSGGLTSPAGLVKNSPEPVPEFSPGIVPEMKARNSLEPKTAQGNVQAEINAAHLRGQPSSLAQASSDRKEGIAGLVANEPLSAKYQRNESDSSIESNQALHPAIENTKPYVSTHDIGPGISPATASSEKPIFAKSGYSPAQKPTEDLARSDSLGGPNVDEGAHQQSRRAAEPNETDENSDDRADDKCNLVSSQASDAVHGSFEQLRESTADNLDDKVEAMLRPMLRAWLDNNLPSIVDGLVRKEIERVSRGK